ncbi:unnamed protein product, partial [Thlaspi arvense]
EKEVICRATVASINTRNDAKKNLSVDYLHSLVQLATTLTPWVFRVDLAVVDAGEKTNFARAGDNGSNRNNIPLCITDLVGKTMDFQVKITNFNFKSSFQSFTVSRVLREINRSHAERFNNYYWLTNYRFNQEVITEETLNPNLSDLTYNINDIEKESIP